MRCGTSAICPTVTACYLGARQAIFRRDLPSREQFLSASVLAIELILILPFRQYHRLTTYHRRSSAFNNSPLGPRAEARGVIDRLALDRPDRLYTRAILSDYFMYSTSKWGRRSGRRGRE